MKMYGDTCFIWKFSAMYFFIFIFHLTMQSNLRRPRFKIFHIRPYLLILLPRYKTQSRKIIIMYVVQASQPSKNTQNLQKWKYFHSYRWSVILQIPSSILLFSPIQFKMRGKKRKDRKHTTEMSFLLKETIFHWGFSCAAEWSNTKCENCLENEAELPEVTDTNIFKTCNIIAKVFWKKPNWACRAIFNETQSIPAKLGAL